MSNADERRKAFEETIGNATLEVFSAEGEIYFTKESLESVWNMACDYMESRLDSPEVVEKVQKAIKTKAVLHCEFPEMRMSIGNPDKVAKAALAELKGSL